MNFAKAYAGTLVAFLVVDVIWIDLLLRGWTFGLAAADVGWGVVLTAASAVCGLLGRPR